MSDTRGNPCRRRLARARARARERSRAFGAQTPSCARSRRQTRAPARSALAVPWRVGCCRRAAPPELPAPRTPAYRPQTGPAWWRSAPARRTLVCTHGAPSFRCTHSPHSLKGAAPPPTHTHAHSLHPIFSSIHPPTHPPTHPNGGNSVPWASIRRCVVGRTAHTGHKSQPHAGQLLPAPLPPRAGGRQRVRRHAGLVGLGQGGGSRRATPSLRRHGYPQPAGAGAGHGWKVTGTGCRLRRRRRRRRRGGHERGHGLHESHGCCGCHGLRGCRGCRLASRGRRCGCRGLRGCRLASRGVGIGGLGWLDGFSLGCGGGGMVAGVVRAAACAAAVVGPLRRD